jgi:glycosyltransferase involved in cell wall biosynthesis
VSPKVSVVIATYNMGQYLGAAIDSVLAQTVGDIEVHVVDDGSTDSTREVIGAYAGDPRLHYHRQANSGQTKAKNLGISKSTGEFVAFCDADDIWTPDKLAIQMPLFEQGEDIGVVYSRKQPIRPDGTALPMPPDVEEHPSGRVTEALFKNNFIPFGTAVVRRKCIDELGAFDERYRMGIDWELWLRISTRYRFQFADTVTYLYRIWPGQMSNNWRGRYEFAFRIMEDFLAANRELVSGSTIREAYAHCYWTRGRVRAVLEHEYALGARDALTSLKFRPTYLLAWKLIGRIGIMAARDLFRPRRSEAKQD